MYTSHLCISLYIYRYSKSIVFFVGLCCCGPWRQQQQPQPQPQQQRQTPPPNRTTASNLILLFYTTTTHMFALAPTQNEPTNNNSAAWQHLVFFAKGRSFFKSMFCEAAGVWGISGIIFRGFSTSLDRKGPRPTPLGQNHSQTLEETSQKHPRTI